MYVFIPLGGAGQRFKNDGYLFPKPLVRAAGEKIINHVVRSLKLNNNEDTLIIGYGSELATHDFESVFLKENPHLDGSVKFKLLEMQTRGAAETLLLMINSFDLDPLEAVLSIDCDTAFVDDVVGMFRARPGNVIFYFEDENDKPIYSYIKVDHENKVTAIQEKLKISTKACAGAYGFSSVASCRAAIEKTINENKTFKGEFYVSCIYATMLADSATVRPVSVHSRFCMGTPDELKQHVTSGLLPCFPKRYCFDLDGTLVTHPVEPGDYATVKAIDEKIMLVRELHRTGHYIIICTARGMRTFKGDVEAVKAAHLSAITETLRRFDVPYHELILGKPHADFYVDDLAVNAHADLAKETGHYFDYIPARHFNEVSITPNEVIKQTSNIGEMYWYTHMPKRLAHLLPRAQVFPPDRIVMQKIHGISASMLYVNKSLTLNHLKAILESLDCIHACPVPEHEASATIDLRDLYLTKLGVRHGAMGPEHSDEHVFQTLSCKLRDYCSSRMNKAVIMHGDPVLTNIMFDRHGCIKLFDMRGKVGEACTLLGDRLYDYAKVYQSLLGYDHVLRGCNEHEYAHLVGTEIVQHFRKSVISMFGTEGMADIATITSFLFYTLIPLHQTKQSLFLRQCRRMLSLEEEETGMPLGPRKVSINEESPVLFGENKIVIRDVLSSTSKIKAHHQQAPSP